MTNYGKRRGLKLQIHHVTVLELRAKARWAGPEAGGRRVRLPCPAPGSCWELPAPSARGPLALASAATVPSPASL